MNQLFDDKKNEISDDLSRFLHKQDQKLQKMKKNRQIRKSFLETKTAEIIKTINNLEVVGKVRTNTSGKMQTLQNFHILLT